MDSAKRACLAFIIGRAVNQDYRSVYDFGAGKFCVFTISGSVGNIHVFDAQRNSVVTGSLESLYDMGTNSFTTVNLSDFVFHIACFQVFVQSHCCKFVNIAFGTGSYE